MAEWHFLRFRPGDTNRSSTAASFFDADNVSLPGDSIIREGIQNSLDAADSGDGPTMVHISLLEGERAPTWQDIEPYFHSVWANYYAEDNGLHSDFLPMREESCRTLVFEDIGAIGLLGDPEEPFAPPKGEKNHFYNFFRAEAVTAKAKGDRGSRGIGKAAFIQASRVNTMFGLTIRQDDHRHLLMGRAILDSHRLNGDSLQGDGYFGEPSGRHEGLTIPVEDEQVIRGFSEAFRLVRESETGLSVVIPWVDEEITEKVLIQSAVRNYFFPILAETLEIWVETNNSERTLDRNGLLAEARNDPDLAGICPEIELADWVMQADMDIERQALDMPSPDRGWSWSRELFPDGLLATISDKLQNRQNIALRVPVTVRKRNQERTPSFFDVYMVNIGSNEIAQPLFVRDDILISDLRARTPRGLRALVVIDDEPLDEFLKQSENPSHTEWQKQRVKQDYVSAAADIEFVRSSVRQIFNLAMAEDKTRDKRLLSNLFPFQAGGEEERNLPEPRKSYVTINRIIGGFTITRGQDAIPVGDWVNVRVAYDVRRGSPMSKYKYSDFHLRTEPMQYELVGADDPEVGDNEMSVRILDPENFRIRVTGFDQNRQIWVKADRRESASADQEV